MVGRGLHACAVLRALIVLLACALPPSTVGLLHGAPGRVSHSPCPLLLPLLPGRHAGASSTRCRLHMPRPPCPGGAAGLLPAQWGRQQLAAARWGLWEVHSCICQNFCQKCFSPTANSFVYPHLCVVTYAPNSSGNSNVPPQCPKIRYTITELGLPCRGFTPPFRGQG